MRTIVPRKRSCLRVVRQGEAHNITAANIINLRLEHRWYRIVGCQSHFIQASTFPTSGDRGSLRRQAQAYQYHWPQ
jgi:hypothetical protein